MIRVKNLNKDFKIHQKEPGFMGSVKALTKRNYVTKKALSDISLDIASGEIVGLIGSNGAGKTTLTKILSGIIHPTSGEVSVMGHTPWERNNEYRRQMAVIMGQKAQLWWDLPAMDGFLLLKEIYKIETKEFHQRVEYLANYLDIKSELRTQVRRLSLGERMKVELIAALIHAPKIVYLDEPTIGLDLSAQKAVRSFLKEYRAEFSPTMILTSHYMDDIEDLCERLIILKSGKKIYDGSIQNLHKNYANKKQIQINCQEDLSLEITKTLPQEFGSGKFSNGKFILSIEKEKLMSATSYLMSHFNIEDLSIQSEELGTIIERIMHSTDEIK